MNLHAVNRDVDELSHQTFLLERKLDDLRDEFYTVIDTETKRLTADSDAVQRHADREANVRRLTERYRAGNLSVGPGEIFGAALYVAFVARHYWEEPESRCRDE